MVSKKVSKSAVKRNRIRRRLYEAVRRQKEWADTPQDMIFSVFSEQLAIVPSKEIDLLVNTLLRQAKIIR